MTYQVLARKWRPRFFREMVGQEHVLKALINALDYNRLHQAYLFTGTRGVGKTTIARILAKCLNCEKGITSEPCGTCSACVEIAQGSFVDLIEIDAASHTGVENMRQITDNVQYTPTKGRYKVYLIDEVHMLTTHSFNALLKTLEEPPEHSKFLLATTDPQKLPATVLSRCLQFHLKNMVPEHIVRHLSHVLSEENIAFEEAGLWALARAAQGSMRDALSLTDQAIAFGQGKVFNDDVLAMLGTIDQQTVYQLAKALIEHNAADVLQVIANASELSPDYAAILDALLTLLHRLSVAQMVPNAVDNSEGDKEQVLALAKQVSAGELQLFYQMGLLGKKDLYLAPDLRTGLEMALLRMLAFRPANVPEPAKNIALNQQATVAATTEQVEAKKFEAAPVTSSLAQPKPVNNEAAEALAEAPAHISEPVPEQPLTNASENSTETIISSGQNIFEDNQHWVESFARFPFQGVLSQVLSECVLVAVNGANLTFTISPEKATFYNERQAEQAAQVMSETLQTPVHVTIQVEDHVFLTPSLYRAEQRQQRRDDALERLSQDNVVQYFQQRFQAVMLPESLEIEGKRV